LLVEEHLERVHIFRADCLRLIDHNDDGVPGLVLLDQELPQCELVVLNPVVRWLAEGSENKPKEWSRRFG
jgi:hypothetical protein